MACSADRKRWRTRRCPAAEANLKAFISTDLSEEEEEEEVGRGGRGGERGRWGEGERRRRLERGSVRLWGPRPQNIQRSFFHKHLQIIAGKSGLT